MGTGLVSTAVVTCSPNLSPPETFNSAALSTAGPIIKSAAASNSPIAMHPRYASAGGTSSAWRIKALDVSTELGLDMFQDGSSGPAIAAHPGPAAARARPLLRAGQRPELRSPLHRRPLRPQVLRSQLVHSLIPHARPASLDLAQVLARGPVELLGVGNPARSPRADLHDDRQQRDGFLGERVDRLLLVRRIIGVVGQKLSRYAGQWPTGKRGWTANGPRTRSTGRSARCARGPFGPRS